MMKKINWVSARSMVSWHLKEALKERKTADAASSNGDWLGFDFHKCQERNEVTSALSWRKAK
jgi:hypothetical protein